MEQQIEKVLEYLPKIDKNKFKELKTLLENKDIEIEQVKDKFDDPKNYEVYGPNILQIEHNFKNTEKKNKEAELHLVEQKLLSLENKLKINNNSLNEILNGTSVVSGVKSLYESTIENIKNEMQDITKRQQELTTSIILLEQDIEILENSKELINEQARAQDLQNLEQVLVQKQQIDNQIKLIELDPNKKIKTIYKDFQNGLLNEDSFLVALNETKEKVEQYDILTDNVNDEEIEKNKQQIASLKQQAEELDAKIANPDRYSINTVSQNLSQLNYKQIIKVRENFYKDELSLMQKNLKNYEKQLDNEQKYLQTSNELEQKFDNEILQLKGEYDQAIINKDTNALDLKQKLDAKEAEKESYNFSDFNLGVTSMAELLTSKKNSVIANIESLKEERDNAIAAIISKQAENEDKKHLANLKSQIFSLETQNEALGYNYKKAIDDVILFTSNKKINEQIPENDISSKNKLNTIPKPNKEKAAHVVAYGAKFEEKKRMLKSNGEPKKKFEIVAIQEALPNTIIAINDKSFLKKVKENIKKFFLEKKIAKKLLALGIAGTIILSTAGAITSYMKSDENLEERDPHEFKRQYQTHRGDDKKVVKPSSNTPTENIEEKKTPIIADNVPKKDQVKDTVKEEPKKEVPKEEYVDDIFGFIEEPEDNKNDKPNGGGSGGLGDGNNPPPVLPDDKIIADLEEGEFIDFGDNTIVNGPGDNDIIDAKDDVTITEKDDNIIVEIPKGEYDDKEIPEKPSDEQTADEKVEDAGKDLDYGNMTEEEFDKIFNDTQDKIEKQENQTLNVMGDVDTSVKETKEQLQQLKEVVQSIETTNLSNDNVQITEEKTI